MSYFERLLESPNKSFLLLGPRGTGKSTWLRNQLAPRVDINLLKSDQYLQFQANPSHLRKMVAGLSPGDWVVIDEVQRVPELLNEVHDLYETLHLNFALTGSSARKLKRANANLLAGRALRCDMFPLTFGELGDSSLIELATRIGTLPHVIGDEAHALDTLAAYVETYLKEEISAEALTRQLEPFARFLRIAAQHHAQLLYAESISSQAGVKRASVDNYFQILEDTLLGYRLPALRLGKRNKEVAHPKFYFFDAGVARAASGWLFADMPDTWRGFSFETLLLNEMRAYNSYKKRGRSFFHYAVTGSFDIDFMVEVRPKIMHQPASYIAIEAKLANRWSPTWGKRLVELADDPQFGIERAYGVYNGTETWQEGQLTVLGFAEFYRRLWSGEIF